MTITKKNISTQNTFIYIADDNESILDIINAVKPLIINIGGVKITRAKQMAWISIPAYITPKYYAKCAKLIQALINGEKQLYGEPLEYEDITFKHICY